jgi:putative membrane protein
MKTLQAIVCFAAAAAIATASLAQSSTPSPNESTQNRRSTKATSGEGNRAVKVSRSDRRFLEKAAEAGMKEVAVSEAVMMHLTHSQTKQFAQMMVNDHTAANQELMMLAQRKGVELPAKDERLARKWAERAEGADDRYMKEMVADHRKVVALFEKGARSEDPEIAAFAQKTLPKLQQHLMMAQGHRMER